jgi:hypothetical protein
MDGVDRIREKLSGDTIRLDKLDDETCIFAHVDAFVNLSRDNETVEQVVLYPATDPGDDASGTHRYAIWDKVAEGIANFQRFVRSQFGVPLLQMTNGMRMPNGMRTPFGMPNGKRMSRTGRFWLASCDVLGGVSIYTWKPIYDYGIQQLFQF